MALTLQPRGAEAEGEGSRVQGHAGRGGPECLLMPPLKATCFHCVLGFLLPGNEIPRSKAT